MLKENLLPILMRLTSVVLASWISSISSKINWILVGWPWSHHVCVCVWVCVCVRVCLFYNMIHGPQKQILFVFLSRNLDFGLEKSWKNHGTFFPRFLWEPWKIQHIKDYRKTSSISRTLVGNKIVDNSDVVGASPVGAAPTTSAFST